MTTKKWLEWFKYNASTQLEVPVESYRLSTEEKQTIQSSIQSFQLGEQSEGKALLKQAKLFAKSEGRLEYVETIKYLIREENLHSSYLGQFMKVQDIPKKTKTTTDTVFRFLRQILGIETNIRVLVTAELVALTYYSSLSRTTRSKVLKTICSRMLEDEQQHVKFQMQHIHEMNYQKPPLYSALSDIGHAFILACTLPAVWLEHRKVLKSEFTFFSFFNRVWSDFIEAMDFGREDALQALGVSYQIAGGEL